MKRLKEAVKEVPQLPKEVEEPKKVEEPKLEDIDVIAEKVRELSFEEFKEKMM